MIVVFPMMVADDDDYVVVVVVAAAGAAAVVILLSLFFCFPSVYFFFYFSPAPGISVLISLYCFRYCECKWLRSLQSPQFYLCNGNAVEERGKIPSRKSVFHNDN